jgi:hypothetical protein
MARAGSRILDSGEVLASKILEMINHPREVEMRKQAKERIEKRNLPTPHVLDEAPGGGGGGGNGGP